MAVLLNDNAVPTHPLSRMDQLIADVRRQKKELEALLARVARLEEQDRLKSRESCSEESSQTNSTQQ